jgi:amidase
MLDDLHYLSIEELARLLAARKVSPVELTEAMLRRIERVDPALKSYALVTPELALAQARTAEQMIGKRRILSQLHGVPVAVKDLCWTEGIATAAGMPLHKDFVPAVDATVVRKLREAGAVLLGKLQLTEGAFADHHPDVPAPLNPWHRDHWSGASSSGSGLRPRRASASARSAPTPAGRSAFRRRRTASPGSSRRGGASRASAASSSRRRSTTSARCAAAPPTAGVVLQAIAGSDPRDPTALLADVPDYLAGDDGTLRGVRIGFDERYALDDVEPDVRRAVEATLATVRALGAEIVALRFPDVACDDRRLGSALRRRDRGRAREDVPVRAPSLRPGPRRIDRCRPRAERDRVPADPAAPARLRRARRRRAGAGRRDADPGAADRRRRRSRG